MEDVEVIKSALKFSVSYRSKTTHTQLFYGPFSGILGDPMPEENF